MKEKTININKNYLKEIKDTLERCAIILEDNQKIKEYGDI